MAGWPSGPACSPIWGSRNCINPTPAAVRASVQSEAGRTPPVTTQASTGKLVPVGHEHPSWRGCRQPWSVAAGDPMVDGSFQTNTAWPLSRLTRHHGQRLRRSAEHVAEARMAEAGCRERAYRGEASLQLQCCVLQEAGRHSARHARAAKRDSIMQLGMFSRFRWGAWGEGRRREEAGKGSGRKKNDHWQRGVRSVCAKSVLHVVQTCVSLPSDIPMHTGHVVVHRAVGAGADACVHAVGTTFLAARLRPDEVTSGLPRQRRLLVFDPWARIGCDEIARMQESP